MEKFRFNDDIYISSAKFVCQLVRGVAVHDAAGRDVADRSAVGRGGDGRGVSAGLAGSWCCCT